MRRRGSWDDRRLRRSGSPLVPAQALLRSRPVQRAIASASRARLTQSLAELGDFEEGLAQGREAIRIAEAVDHPMSLAYACARLGYLHAVKGELEQGACLLERARELTRDWKITFTAAIVTGH